MGVSAQLLAAPCQPPQQSGALSPSMGGGLTPNSLADALPPVRLSASRCSWKGRFPQGSADVRAGEGPSGGACGSAPNTCPCLTDAGKGGVLASPGIHWRKEKADCELPHLLPSLFLLNCCQGWVQAQLPTGVLLT